MADITILINSCDSYEDVWDPLFCSLRDMWPDLPYPIFLNAEGKAYANPAFAIRTLGAVASGVEPWGRRLLRHLRAIDTEYVLMLFDDYILERRVDTSRIEQCKVWLEGDRDIGAFYLVGGGFSKVPDTRYHGFSRVRPRSDYIVNSAPALWDKSTLESFVGENDTPWAWEYFGSARAYREGTEFYAVADKQEELYSYQYERGGAIHQGKWVKAVIEPAIQRYSLTIDCSKRGYDEPVLKRRKLSWYARFYVTGWNMVKWDVFIFLKRAIFRALARAARKIIRAKNGRSLHP